MKFVFEKHEVALALAMSSIEFDNAKANLELMGFPKPIAGLVERWSIMDVMNWVNRNQDQTVVQPSLESAATQFRSRSLN